MSLSSRVAVCLLMGSAALSWSCERNQPAETRHRSQKEMKAPALGSGFKSYSSPYRSFSLTIPSGAYRTEHLSFSVRRSSRQYDESLSIFGENSRRVLDLAVWDNREGLDLPSWFDLHLKFLLRNDASLSRIPAFRLQGEIWIIDVPRSGQAYAQRIAVFTAADYVFRLTLYRADKEEDERIFTKMLESIEVTGVRS